jgi:NAD(P)-dependent dehydrogenase (short-subunit alcohol dehydrogenase family)
MEQRLKGRNAVVTGAGRGIGRAVALALAEQGARVVVNDPGVNIDGTGNDAGPADQLVDEIKSAGGVAVSNYDSVADAAGGERMIQQCIDEFGRLDILVNVAGILRDRMVFNMSEEEWDAVIAVHLKGHFNTIRPASIVMRHQRYGRIVNFSSGTGLRGNSGQANYGAAKAGIVGLTRVVAKDLGKYGVSCNAIAPSAQTRMIATVSDEVRRLRSQRGISQARGGSMPDEMTPGHVAPMVVYLCCDEAWNINGQIFWVSGGNISLASEELPLREIITDGEWTLDELTPLVLSHLTFDLRNPAPPAEERTAAGGPR